MHLTRQMVVTLSGATGQMPGLAEIEIGMFCLLTCSNKSFIALFEQQLTLKDVPGNYFIKQSKRESFVFL